MYTQTYQSARPRRQPQTIHPKDILPNCPHCGKPISYIRRKGMSAVKVDPRPFYYLPQEDGPVNVITIKGNKRKGIIVNDGIKGYFEHVCRR